MSKLSFRAKALDPGKPMPVYIGDEIPDLPDFSAVNRTVPEMPTGMEKEEETEHHLQRALSAQQVYGTAEVLVIPIPDMDIVEDRYKKLYCSGAPFKLPKQYIHVQPWGLDEEIPEYDMDSEDEQWLMHQVKNLKMDVKPIKFENMMDRLEKGSGQMVVTLREAKALLKEDDDLTMAVYDYWLNKRLRLQHSLIPQVKTEKRDGTSTNNPYVAFRRRAEKMQTRKNRKNDETSYGKMLKLRKDLSRTLLILEMLKRREKSKKELLKLTTEVAEKRYQLQDWDGKLLEEVNAKKDLLPVFQPILLHHSTKRDWMTATKEDGANACKKREYKKRKHKTPVNPVERIMKQHHPQQQKLTHLMHRPFCDPTDSRLGLGIGTDDEGILSGSSPSDHDGDSEPDGIYMFRRKPGCAYHAPCHVKGGQWPWGSREQSGFGEKKYKYSMTSLGQMRNCLGYARRRLGRGGCVIFDRAFTLWDKSLRSINWSSQNSPFTSDYNNHLKMNNIPHFQPISSRCLNNMLSGACEKFPSVLPPLGLSAVVTSRSQEAISHSDRPYFASTICDSEPKPAAGDSASLLPNVNCKPTVVAAHLTVSDASYSPSNGSQSTSASVTGHRPQEPAQGPDECPMVSTVFSQSAGNNAGLSTLPAASILQLNYPLTNSPRHTASSTSNKLQPLMSSRCSLPTQTSTNNCRIIKSVISRSGALNIQQLTNNAHKVTASCPRPELTAVNHVNLPTFATNAVSSQGGMTMTSPNHSDHASLVPLLRLPGTTANRNDNKSKETLESLNHIAKESVVGVEVT